MQELRAINDPDRCGRADPAQLATDVTAFSQITEPMLSLLYAYWDGKRGDRRFPGRSDLDPVDIPSLLPSIFLVAVHRDPFDLVFRLAGGVLTACYGSTMTGDRLIDLPGSATAELYEQAARAARSGRRARGMSEWRTASTKTRSKKRSTASRSAFRGETGTGRRWGRQGIRTAAPCRFPLLRSSSARFASARS